MSRLLCFSLGFLAAAVPCAVLVHSQRSETQTSTEASSSPQPKATQETDQSEQAALLQERAEQQTPARTDPSAEVLRLRGRIGQLTRELDATRKERAEAFNLMFRKNAWSLMDLYWAQGIDTNSVPNFASMTTRQEAMDELRRVGAKVLADEPEFIHAEVQLPTTTNGGVITDYVTIYVDTNGTPTSMNNSQRLRGH